jgi:hypothetical protein
MNIICIEINSLCLTREFGHSGKKKLRFQM